MQRLGIMYQTVEIPSVTVVADDLASDTQSDWHWDATISQPEDPFFTVLTGEKTVYAAPRARMER